LYRRIITLLGFGGRDVADGFKRPPMIETVDPFDRSVLDGLERSSLSPSVDHLGVVNTIERLGQSVVIAVADTADQGSMFASAKSFGILDRDVLAAAIAGKGETAAVRRSAIVQTLVRCVEVKAGGSSRLARQPTIQRALVSMANAT
jgi:hypothetical protein